MLADLKGGRIIGNEMVKYLKEGPGNIGNGGINTATVQCLSQNGTTLSHLVCKHSEIPHFGYPLGDTGKRFLANPLQGRYCGSGPKLQNGYALVAAQ